MKLFKCEFGANYNSLTLNLIPKGANFALLGISKQKMLNLMGKHILIF